MCRAAERREIEEMFVVQWQCFSRILNYIFFVCLSSCSACWRYFRSEVFVYFSKCVLIRAIVFCSAHDLCGIHAPQTWQTRAWLLNTTIQWWWCFDARNWRIRHICGALIIERVQPKATCRRQAHCILFQAKPFKFLKVTATARRGGVVGDVPIAQARMV